MAELSQVTNVSVLVGIIVGIVLGLVWVVPKVSGLFKSPPNGKNGSGPQEVKALRSIGPDPCHTCRTEVHDLLHVMNEHRTEERLAKERLAQSYDHLSDVMGEVRDSIRDWLAEQRGMRQTGDGLRIPRVGPGEQR